MAKKSNTADTSATDLDTEAQHDEQQTADTSAEPTTARNGSEPSQDALDNPNAATGSESDQTNLDQQEAQPEKVEVDETASPTTEAALHHEGDTTRSVPAGTADATADPTADGFSQGTTNTHPQSPAHDGDLSDDEKLDILEETNAPGAVIGKIAAAHNITPERVTEIVDEQNGVERDQE
jgi:hypothetical protein